MIGLLSTLMVFAGPDLVTASDPQSVHQAMTSYAPATLTRTEDGDPVIEAQYPEGKDAGGYSVYFIDCEDGKDCRSVLFYTWWDTDEVTLDAVNDWNETSKFGRAYIDEDGNPAVEMSVNLYGGVTRDNFVDSVDWWDVLTSDFSEVVYPE